MLNRFLQSISAGCAAFLVLACNLATPTVEPAVTPMPETWETLAAGLERRVYNPTDGFLSQLLVLRIDPAYYTFRAHYRSGDPLTARSWQTEIAGAVAFVNANFFSRENQILGLLIADGVVHGQSYYDRGGTFLVQDGQPRVRSNITEPYYGELLEQAVQAFPMLVQDGQQAYTNTHDTDVSRRTVVGQDTDGRILLMVTPLGGISLRDLSAYLPTTDLNLTNAFNLDGGGSTMMSITPANMQAYLLGGFDAVPAVLAVYPK